MTRIIDFETIIVQVKVYGGGIAKAELFRLLSKKPSRFMGYGGFVKHGEICKKFGLIIEKEERFQITDIGNEFLQLIPIEEGKYIIGRKSEQQKKLLKKILKNRWSELIGYFADAASELVYDNEERQILFRKDEWQKVDEAFVEILEEIQVIKAESDSYVISNEIESKFYRPNIKRKITEEEFDELNIKRKKIGKRAEELTVSSERIRVFKQGKILDVSKIKRVSDDKKKGISMGYDVDSFDGDENIDEYNRFIEVKGTSGQEPEIFWSENEITKAKELGKQYWLYVWINVGTPDEKIARMIPNPYEEIMENDKIIKLPKTTYMIDLKNWFELEDES